MGLVNRYLVVGSLFYNVLRKFVIIFFDIFRVGGVCLIYIWIMCCKGVFYFDLGELKGF